MVEYLTTDQKVVCSNHAGVHALLSMTYALDQASVSIAAWTLFGFLIQVVDSIWVRYSLSRYHRGTSMGAGNHRRGPISRTRSHPGGPQSRHLRLSETNNQACAAPRALDEPSWTAGGDKRGVDY
jgi:hypothetical protein